MKKILLICSLLILNACVSTSLPPLQGTKELPLETGSINKHGYACSYYLLGFVGPFGSNSLIDAAHSARISKVLYYDESYEYYVLFGRQCRDAYGY